MTRRLSPRSAVVGLAAFALALGLAGCTGTTPETAATTSSSTAPDTSASDAPSAEPTPSEGPAAFRPDGDAAANLPIFSEVVSKVWASDEREHGRAYIDALVAAGFTDKTTMQLTPDQTSIGQTAESIQFAVRWNGGCLVGQVGSATREPVTSIQPVLSGDVCLIGTTRAIDW